MVPLSGALVRRPTLWSNADMAKGNHHIVPQFYLRNFANGVGRKARFTAFERETGRSFGAVVRDVAATRHFNRIKTDDGTDPDALENAVMAFPRPHRHTQAAEPGPFERLSRSWRLPIHVPR
jgi:hypothetical protein